MFVIGINSIKYIAAIKKLVEARTISYLCVRPYAPHYLPDSISIIIK